MIYHSVYFEPLAAERGELATVMSGLAALVGALDGFVGFHHGENIDLEGKSPEAPYGFVCVFTDRSALELYANDLRHRALGGRLVALCGGSERIKVYDIDTGAF